MPAVLLEVAFINNTKDEQLLASAGFEDRLAESITRGVLDYSDATTQFRAPIHVRLSRIGTCGTKRAYLRQTITFDRASDRRQWGALDGATELFCPAEG